MEEHTDRPDAAYPHAAPSRRRKSGSFVLRLTMGQFLRMLRNLFLIDCLVLVLSVLLILIGLEQDLHYRKNALSEADGLIPVVFVEEPPLPNLQFRLPQMIEKELNLVPDALRGFSLQENEDGISMFGSRSRTLKYYIVAAANESGDVGGIVYDLTRPARMMLAAFLILLLVEALMLIGHVAGTRKAVRKTLAPIRQLAETAQRIQTVAVTQEKKAPLKPPDERELSKTISTLNRITAKRLDTRISIENERDELKGLGMAINGMLDRLDAAYSSQLRFVSDASHELRTPISVIQGYANLLDRWGKEDPVALQESIDAIKAEAESMKNLVEKLLFLARSDNDSIVLQTQLLDLSELAEEVLRETELIDTSHQFVGLIEPLVVVEGDSGLIKQALRIFMDNAIKYSPDGGEIRISVSRKNNRAYVSVQDQGIGIPEEDLPHLIERFYRSDESRARKTGGTGLGLSIADWTVRRHNGHIELLSRLELGTRLTMVLPAAKAETVAAVSGE